MISLIIRSALSNCSGLQHRQFSQAAGIAQVSETMVPANAQRQAHQDRSQGGQPCPLRDISNGGSGSAADAPSGNPCPNPAVAFFGNTCEAGMMCGTAENRFLEWRATVAVCQNSRKRRLLGVSVQLFGRFCDTTRRGGQNIVDNEMILRYYKTLSLKQCFGEVHREIPDYTCHKQWVI